MIYRLNVHILLITKSILFTAQPWFWLNFSQCKVDRPPQLYYKKNLPEHAVLSWPVTGNVQYVSVFVSLVGVRAYLGLSDPVQCAKTNTPFTRRLQPLSLTDESKQSAEPAASHLSGGPPPYISPQFGVTLSPCSRWKFMQTFNVFSWEKCHFNTADRFLGMEEKENSHSPKQNIATVEVLDLYIFTPILTVICIIFRVYS